MNRVLKKLGKRLKTLRTERGITQEALAEKVNIHQTYVGKLETGRSNPSTLMLYKISRALDVKLCDIFEFDK